MARSAVDAFIKFRGKCTTRSFLKIPFSEFELGLGFRPLFLASQIHTNSSSHEDAKLDDALNLFNKMKQTRPLPSVVEFNQILDVVNKSKHYSTSLDIFKQLCSLGVSVDDHTIKALVFSCCQLGRTNDAFAALGWNLKRAAGPNIIHDVHTFTHLLNGLFCEGRIHKAQELFNNLIKHNLCQPDICMYNVMIRGLCYCGPIKRANEMVDKALTLFNEMGSSISPDLFTYNSLLVGLCQLCRWQEASVFLKESLDKGFSPDHETFTILLQSLLIEGNIHEAHLVLDLMHEKDIAPDLISLTKLVQTHCLHNDMTKARYFYDLMLARDLVPPIDTYNILIESYCKHNLLDEAMLIYYQMSEKDFKPNELLFDTMIDHLFSAGRVGDGHKLLHDMRVQGHMLDSTSYRRILMTLCFQGRLEEALSFFHLECNSKLNSDTLVYSNLIEGAIRCGNNNVARELFSEISVKGLKPNNYAYTQLIRAFFKEGLLNDAKKLFSEMQESGCEPDEFTYRVLIGGFLQNKQYDDVAMLLRSMDGSGYYLDPHTATLLDDAVAAGSLDTTMSMLIGKLAQEQEMEIPHIAA